MSRSERSLTSRLVAALSPFLIEKSGKFYLVASIVMFPVNLLLGALLFWRYDRRSVVHIGETVHTVHHFAETQRQAGINARFIGCTTNPRWTKCDRHHPNLQWLFLDLFRDMWVLWTWLARFEVIHAHCMMGLSHYQWEFFILKLMRRKLVVHFRGCEGRTRDVAMRQTETSICIDCDYFPNYLCLYHENRRRRWVASKLADHILVTTPDMKDFFPQAKHVPFFTPPDIPEPQERPYWTPDCGRPMLIVHVTNQPGIEATDTILRVMARLRKKGRNVEFLHVTGKPRAEVLRLVGKADLAVGKMRMGYFANAQIESMMLGVPTITWVREDLMTPELLASPFIFSSLHDLGAIIEGLMDDPTRLAECGRRARAGILALHDNRAILTDLISTVYGWPELVGDHIAQRVPQ